MEDEIPRRARRYFTIPGEQLNRPAAPNACPYCPNGAARSATSDASGMTGSTSVRIAWPPTTDYPDTLLVGVESHSSAIFLKSPLRNRPD
jgi:hypothetical protein